ncbi:uncharacterized protein LOC110732878 [Chenopodium quinoa]|uniref:uncharacterized protein LOC110732878 n=1 Tax=Chenopodium quinoa TaxID=63459 RepID=UPI000B775FDF|nr:uncharacterized protein LOC110732878 [Chenopodium quinoa]
MGQQPLTPQAVVSGYTGSSPAAYRLAKGWHEQLDITKAYLNKAANKMKKWADKNRRPLEFQEGDLVMVKLLPHQFKVFRKVHKGLVRKYEGPFPIIRKVGKVSYNLELPPKLKIHPVFHVSMLKPYHADLEDQTRGKSQRAPTAVVASFERDIESIETKRVIRRRGVPSYNEYFLSNAGLRAEYWSSSNLQLKEPELTVGPEGCAAFLPDDAQIDVHSAVALIEKDNIHFIPHNRYAEFYNDPAVCLMRYSKDGKVDAVKTNNNKILHAKEAVVIAAGSWTGSLMHNLARDLDVTINVPVQPRKGYLLVFENIKSNLRLNHATMEAGYVNYQRTSTENSSKSTDISMTATIDAKGNLLVGSNRQFVGFNGDLDMHIVEQIWKRTQEFFPALRNISLESLSQEMKVRTGFRPYMPDGKPVIGPIPSMPNVYLATGHEGGGISMALGTAELIADMVLGNSLKLDPTPFAAEGRCC